jgi:hypothetical protein
MKLLPSKLISHKDENEKIAINIVAISSNTDCQRCITILFLIITLIILPVQRYKVYVE